MRISLALLFAVVLQLSAEDGYAQRTRVAISMNNVSVEQVLNKIEETSDYVFLYNDKTIQKNRIVSVRNNSGKILDILDEVFKGTNVTYTVVDKQIILSTNKLNVIEQDPTIQVKGTVKDTKGEPLIGVNVKVKPHQVTLVPDDPSQITSNSGWDTKANQEFLTEVLDQFNSAGIRTSVFVAADPEMVEYAAKAGADRVELYTEPYATDYPKNPEAAIAPFIEAAKTARKLGIGLNAGHDLSLVNLNYFYKNIPWVDEVSIGHALISDALYLGLERTIQEYKNCLRS